MNVGRISDCYKSLMDILFCGNAVVVLIGNRTAHEVALLLRLRWRRLLLHRRRLHELLLLLLLHRRRLHRRSRHAVLLLLLLRCRLNPSRTIVVATSLRIGVPARSWP